MIYSLDLRTLATIHDAEVDKLLEEERIELQTSTTHLVNGEKEIEPNRKATPRIRDRDQGRLQEAMDLEMTSRSHRCRTWQVVQMSVDDRNLKDHSDIIPLLHYLRDYIIYKCGGFYMKPRNIG